MIRRFAILLAAAAAVLALLAPSASAAAPTVGSESVTNIQGTSAVLLGAVNPQGLATSYYFEYGTNSAFAGASRTAVTSAGSGASNESARAQIGGLAPSTRYYYRLVASNSSGTTTGAGNPGVVYYKYCRKGYVKRKGICVKRGKKRKNRGHSAKGGNGR